MQAEPMKAILQFSQEILGRRSCVPTPITNQIGCMPAAVGAYLQGSLPEDEGNTNESRTRR